MQENLGGIMFWSLEADDSANKCNKGKYSLLRSAKAAMLYTNFIHKTPILSQTASAIQALSGDLEEARQSQITFLKQMANQIDEVSNHELITAAIICASGDWQKCKEASIIATRPTYVIAPDSQTSTFDEENPFEKFFTGSANPTKEHYSVASAALSALLSRIAGGTPNSIGINRNPLCRRKRSSRKRRVVCQMFDDVENFEPVRNLRNTPVNDGSPIQRVQRNPAAGNRVEYVDARIRREHLRIRSEG